jgi:hypothetical protein
MSPLPRSRFGHASALCLSLLGCLSLSCARQQRSSLVARFDDLTLWRFDPDQLSRAPRPLVDSYGYEPSFEPSGKYLLQTDWSRDQPVLVWRLDQPEQVHHIDSGLHATWVR